ncbi:MAG: tripartite tricarboxylate transporter TctB family protein [Spirochaetaceae bacterium]|nr:tripartite tricarboxylate transporter TctB family protein [Spirochaetaceae bacterium]
MKKTRRVDFGMGLGFMALAVFIFVIANGFLKADKGIGPGDYPKVVAAGLFILGAILAVDSFLRGFPPLTEKIDWTKVRKLIIFIAVTLVYVQSMRLLGFIVVTPVFLCFGMYFFGYRKWLTITLVSICVTASIHIIFREIFLVMLPTFRLF